MAVTPGPASALIRAVVGLSRSQVLDAAGGEGFRVGGISRILGPRRASGGEGDERGDQQAAMFGEHDDFSSVLICSMPVGLSLHCRIVSVQFKVFWIGRCGFD